MRICIDRRRTKRRQIVLLACIFLVGISLFSQLCPPSLAAEGASRQDSLFLNVYLDPAGKALVTGYADDISGLEFLATSEYQYENDTHRLYALTDGLTAKSSQLWTLNLDAVGVFEDYRITFYLPGDMRLGQINASSGLQYHLSAFNDSLVADVQGYEVQDPSISIQYQQPLATGPAPFSPPAVPPGLPPGDPGTDINLLLFLVGGFVLAMGSALGVILWRRRFHPPASPSPLGKAEEIPSPPRHLPPAASRDECPASLDRSQNEGSSEFCPSAAERVALADEADGGHPPVSSSSFADTFADGSGIVPPSHLGDDASVLGSEDIEEPHRPGRQPDADLDQASEMAAIKPGEEKRIQLSREMEAVIQTLTPREQAVITTLVEHGGRMTQADIRYETRTPKSSLTGILVSLERRHLVTKKEWGRTNIIELSEWFLSQRERS